MSDMYDGSGKLYRLGYTLNAPQYEVPAPTGYTFGTIDLLARSWFILSWAPPGSKVTGTYAVPIPPRNYFTPEALTGAGIR